MQDPKWAIQVPMGLFAAHLIVEAASVRTGPLPLLSHLIQLLLGILAVVVSVRMARRSYGLEREFWWFASAGYALWRTAQALDSYFGLILKIPFEQRWAIDVLYYAWPASLVIGLSLRPQGEEKNWI